MAIARLKDSALKNQTRFKQSALAVFVLIFGGLGAYYLLTSRATVPTEPTIGICGERQASDIEEYAGPGLGTSPISTTVIDGTTLNLAIDDFHLLPGSPDKWYIKDGTNFYIYNATTNSQLSSFSIAGITLDGQLKQQFAVDSSGDVYVTGTYTIYKIDTGGNLVWSKTAATPLDRGAYGYGSGTGFRVAAYGRGLNGSYVWDDNGNPQTNNLVVGSEFHTNLANSDIITGDGQYVRIYSADGMTQKFYMGTNLSASAAGPFHFYAAGGADELSDGTIVANDGHGLYFFDSSGVYEGKVFNDPGAYSSGSISPQIYGSDLLLYNGYLYFTSGVNFGRPQSLSRVSLTAAQTVVNSPQGVPFHLGIGAGPFTNVADNYFPSGTTPQVYLRFYQWWQSQAADFSGDYTIRSIEQIKAGDTGTANSFTIPTSLSSYTNGYADIPVTLPSTQPGMYEMNVHLLRNGQTVGADCLDYSIGESNSGVNTSSSNLASGGDLAGVERAHQFGQKLFRSQYGLPICYAGVTAPTMSTVPSCPASMVNDVNAAAALAQQYGMNYEIQLGANGSGPYLSGDTAVFQNLVQQMAAALPAVTDWECWNEPDTNTFSSGNDYVTRALIPCYQGIKAASAGNTVVGGSFSSMSPTSSWWSQFMSAGLSYVDVVGLHTYTGHNRSDEEEGYIIPPLYATNGETGIIQQFQQDLKNDGFNGPIWDTEQGFWVDGTYNSYTQGDRLIRKQILERSIGITDFSNFQNNADYLIGGLTYSLIHNGSFTAGGVASGIYADKLGGRSFIQWLSTGVPHTYAAEFGPSGSDSGDMVAIWSDDFNVNVVPALSGSGTISVTDEFGQPASVASGTDLQLSGSVHYLSVPSGKSLAVTPAETFGANVAAAANGASAAASSSYSCGSFSLTPDRAIDGTLDTKGLGNICDSSGMSIWVGGASDANPTLTITLPSAKTIDRVYVSSQGLGSVEVGLRDYTISFDTGSGSFGNAVNVTNQFLAHNNLVQLPSAVSGVTRIQISGMDINYSGYGDGLPPSFWNSGFASQPTIYELEAYSPGAITKSADLNHDGSVNIIDLSILLSDWGTSNAAADINQDGTVNITDLSILLSQYGQ